MRVVAITILLGACGDGSRGGSVAAPTDFPTDDRADLQNGTDDDRIGGASSAFAECFRTSDCTRGTCLNASSTRAGFCLTVCAAPFNADLGSIRVESCVRGETCAIIDEGAGLCLLPCTTDSDCPDSLKCDRLESGSVERFCVRRSSTIDEETPAAPPSSSADAG